VKTDSDTGDAGRGQSLARDLSQQSLVQGVIIAFVGYASSFAIVIQGLAALGATPAQIASGLFVLGLAKGFVAMWLSLYTRQPITIAWTTPGFALMASMSMLTGGFEAAVGAFIIVGLGIALAGIWSPLARLITAIPPVLASAMLAGVLLKLCLAPFVALSKAPFSAAAILFTWLLVGRFSKLYAVPAAVLVTIVAISLTQSVPAGAAPVIVWAMPWPIWVTPTFTFDGLINLALPLFIVTMASQNITGLAVLASFGYRPGTRLPFLATGLASMLIAPFGGGAVNLAAITAALCAGPDAHPDRARRYVAAISAGVGYMAFALLAGVATLFVTRASPVLIEAVAGLALIGALGSALSTALKDESERMPALLTFLFCASGVSVFGIGSAFWGLVLGWAMRSILVSRSSL
jgi:benzoate membrane transport protein